MADFGEESVIKQADIENLLEQFSRTAYSAKGDVTGLLVLKTCLDLLGKDYTYTVINNSGGQLCGHYPSQIVVLEYEGSAPSTLDNRYQSLNNAEKLKELMQQARLARCWTRFPAPVILYKGKHVCRSSTLASWQELLGRKGMDMLMTGGTANGRTANEDIQSSTNSSGSQQVFDKHRGKDIQLLEELKVKYICDLMVEMKKIKCGIYITSSEKVDKENRYKNFKIIALPYPGCEFFSKWKDCKYDSENVHYDWTQELNTAPLDLQNDPLLTSLPFDWKSYKSWDLVKLSQHYLRALIQILEKGNSGLLIHCISGWDRTPLFVSMLRLSLWADGAIHKSLPPSDILYLTLAYDWYLFGHGLSDRLNKGQEIMYFCFKMLQYIGGDEFSVNAQREGESPRQPSQASSTHSSEHRYPHPSLQRDMDGLKHQGSNVSLSSNTSFGSDCVPFIMDTTQDEDSPPPLDWDVTGSPQRSRHSSGNSMEGSAGHGARRRPSRVDSPLHRGSPTRPDRSSPHHWRHGNSSSAHSDGRRGQSPDVAGSQDSHSHRGCPVAVSCGGEQQPLASSVVSNHFSSSPVNVPSSQSAPPDQGVATPTPSFGSWVDVGMPQMTPPQLITPPKNPPSFDTQASINSCAEASDLDCMTTRRRRLNAVGQMFEEAYLKVILSKQGNSIGALSSIIGNVAEKMGFRSGPR